MKLLNGHDLNKGDSIKVIGFPDTEVLATITHVCSKFIHISDMMFWKTSGQPANLKALGLKLSRK
jgi:hypothetical protein